MYHIEQQNISVLFNQNKLQVMHHFGHANESNSNALKSVFRKPYETHEVKSSHEKVLRAWSVSDIGG